jgi:hypothetical protein
MIQGIFHEVIVTVRVEKIKFVEPFQIIKGEPNFQILNQGN